MIGLDTNVIVRYLVQDDPEQVEKVDRWFREAEERGETCRLDVIVLCEMVWVLDSVYGRGRTEIASALETLLDTRTISIADRERVHRAVEQYRNGRGDFSDYLIGERNHAAGCRTTRTFDRALTDSDFFTVA